MPRKFFELWQFHNYTCKYMRDVVLANLPACVDAASSLHCSFDAVAWYPLQATITGIYKGDRSKWEVVLPCAFPDKGPVKVTRDGAPLDVSAAEWPGSAFRLVDWLVCIAAVGRRVAVHGDALTVTVDGLGGCVDVSVAGGGCAADGGAADVGHSRHVVWDGATGVTCTLDTTWGRRIAADVASFAEYESSFYDVHWDESARTLQCLLRGTPPVAYKVVVTDGFPAHAPMLWRDGIRVTEYDEDWTAGFRLPMWLIAVDAYYTHK